MKRTYQWVDHDETGRTLRVIDHQEGITMEFPRSAVEPRVCRGFANGAADVTEAFIAKIAADASGSMKAVEKRLLGGPDPSAVEAELRAKIAELMAKLESK